MKTALKLKIFNSDKMRRLGPITSINRLPSKLIDEKSDHSYILPTHFQPTPSGGANFLTILYLKFG